MTIRDEILAAKPLSCKVIDAHTHVGAYDLSGWHQKHDAIDIASVLEYNDRLGIDCMVTTPHPLVIGKMDEANRISERLIAEFEGKIYAYIAVIPSCGLDAVKRELARCSGIKGFLGLKFLPGYYHGDLTAREYQYAMDFANEVGCPVLCHVWENGPAHSDIADAVRNRQNMKFIIAHQGGGYPHCTRSASDIVRNNPNVYLELCGSMDNQYSIRKIVELAGEDKVIFGTDGINLDPKYELGRVALATVSDDVKRKILAENYLKLLKTSQLGSI